MITFYGCHVPRIGNPGPQEYAHGFCVSVGLFAFV